MDINHILQADILDIIFDGRNKDYGAYALRKNYNKRLAKALMGMGGILLVIFVGTVLANSLVKKPEGKINGDVVIVLDRFDPQKPIAPPTPPPLPAPPPQIKMTQFTIPAIVPDELADNPPPPIEILEHSTIGPITHDGVDNVGIIAPPVETKGPGIAVAPKVEHKDIDDIVTIVEIQARFPGGLDGWKRFLERNLQFPEAAQENGIQGVVKVQLVVDKDGNVSQVKALNNLGYGLAEEAERVIKKGPKWIPAEQNGRNVSYRFVQTITFQIAQ